MIPQSKVEELSLSEDKTSRLKAAFIQATRGNQVHEKGWLNFRNVLRNGGERPFFLHGLTGKVGLEVGSWIVNIEILMSRCFIILSYMG